MPSGAGGSRRDAAGSRWALRFPLGPLARGTVALWPGGGVSGGWGYAARVEIGTGEGVARVEVGGPAAGERAFLLVLTHGAGGGPDSPDLLAVADAASRLGGAVARVTQPYRVRSRRAPGSPDRQDAAWVEVVAALRAKVGAGLPLIQGGRSNGARVACRTARAVGARAVIALAFPLHPPGRPALSRAAELAAAGTDVLVVNGERDPFGIPEGTGKTRVAVLAGESHALSKSPGEAGRAAGAWLQEILAGSGVAR
jgi:predicted alpha/beta-hydrolase family hydrolase